MRPIDAKQPDNHVRWDIQVGLGSLSRDLEAVIEPLNRRFEREKNTKKRGNMEKRLDILRDLHAQVLTCREAVFQKTIETSPALKQTNSLSRKVSTALRKETQ